LEREETEEDKRK